MVYIGGEKLILDQNNYNFVNFFLLNFVFWLLGKQNQVSEVNQRHP
jgi:hypothetical protein